MKIYNTLTRRKEELVPVSPEEIKIYVCGPTVYNFFHIGNARPFVVFDTLRRYLEYRGNHVRYVQNFTDVDDKIINKAKEEGLIANQVSEKYIQEYFSDAAALNVRAADVHPKVTDNIDNIVEFVKDLIDLGYAYEMEGDVYFSTRSYPEYGKLSRQNIEELESGARVMVEEKKHDPLDFALWKAQKNPEEVAWDSPWGLGRPGWHIECSAMSRRYLGETIDIHAGGQDLTFPHHENEIAQSEAHNGKPFAKYWMHNGYITRDNEKMSKSKGNFFTVRDILKSYDGEVIRFFLLSGHYRSPINFSEELMEQAKSGLARMRTAKETLAHLRDTQSDKMSETETDALQGLELFRTKFVEAMEDDLNTADALAAIFELVSAINHHVKDGCSKGFAEGAWTLLTELSGVLGLLEKEDQELIDPEVAELIRIRELARINKDYAKSDQIRDQLKAMGIRLKDTPQGVQVIRE